MEQGGVRGSPWPHALVALTLFMMPESGQGWCGDSIAGESQGLLLIEEGRKSARFWPEPGPAQAGAELVSKLPGPCFAWEKTG